MELWGNNSLSCVLATGITGQWVSPVYLQLKLWQNGSQSGGHTTLELSLLYILSILCKFHMYVQCTLILTIPFSYPQISLNLLLHNLIFLHYLLNSIRDIKTYTTVEPPTIAWATNKKPWYSGKQPLPPTSREVLVLDGCEGGEGQFLTSEYAKVKT